MDPSEPLFNSWMSMLMGAALNRMRITVRTADSGVQDVDYLELEW